MNTSYWTERRPPYRRQDEITPEVHRVFTERPNWRKRIGMFVKYIFSILIISGLVLASAKWAVPYLRKHHVSHVQCWRAKINVYSSFLIAKLLTTITTLKSDILHRRAFMKLPGLSYKSKLFAFRTLLRINGLCRRLRNAVTKIFAKDEEEDEKDENNIVLNLFGIIEVRKHDGDRVPVIPRMPRLIKPAIMERQCVAISSTSYEKVKDVIRRWNNVMDLIYSI